jgi:hypothetical protein
MALNIPNTDLPGASFLKGIDTGSTMFSRLMQPVLAREKQKQQAEQFAQELALKKQQEARLGANSGLNRQIAEQNLLNLKHKNDLPWAMQQLQAKLEYLQNLRQQSGKPGGVGGGQNMGGQQEQQPVNLMDMINPDQGQEMTQGQGAMMPQEEQQQPINPMGGQEQPEQPEKPGSGQLPGGIDMDEINRALTYQALGLKVPTNGIYKEPPQIKRMNDLRSKMEEAKYKHDLKIAETQTKEELKNEATRHKAIEAAKNDIPHLKETLRSLRVMKKIANDPKNSDMFGHWWLGHDKAAQRIKNPNAGTWQVHGLAPIVDAEMKMSSKGNIVALKSAQANKPNFGEDQSVAQSKLKAQIDQIERRIKDTEQIANQSGGTGEEVKHLNGKTYKKIGGEWHEVD